MRYDFYVYFVYCYYIICVIFLGVFANFFFVIKKSYHNTCNKHQDK